MEKFYTPEIDHFHIGFEYQWKNTDNFPNSDWVQGVIKDGKQIDDIFNSIYDIRVKRLDRSDIEAEGFVYSHTLINENNKEQYTMCYVMEFNLGRFQLEHTFENTLNISGLFSDNPQKQSQRNIFHGTIRNISEFRKLIKQLNIK